MVVLLTLLALGFAAPQDTASDKCNMCIAACSWWVEDCLDRCASKGNSPAACQIRCGKGFDICMDACQKNKC